MIMAFEILQSLGEEKFRTVVQKLLGGTRASLVAKLIREQWGDCQEVSDNTLVEELKALHEAASIKTRAMHEQGDVAGEDNRFLQLRDSRLGCLERLIHTALATENAIDSITKDGRLTDSEDRIVIALIKLNMQQIAMIQDMKLDIGLDPYKRGMSAEEIDACDRYEFEEKMRWIDADRRVDKWLKIHKITGDDEEDFLRRYHAKYGEGQGNRNNGESASSTSSPPAPMPEATSAPPPDSEISRIYDDLLQRLDAISRVDRSGMSSG
jgi:hypothetical protein